MISAQTLSHWRAISLRKLVLIGFSLVFGLTLLQPANADDSAVPAAPKDWPMVGEAELKVLWWNIYHAELFGPDGKVAKAGAPALLTLTYQRDFTAQELLKETRKQLQPFSNKTQQDKWIDELKKIWPDINKGQQLSFYIDKEGNGYFYENGKPLGGIDDPEFSKAFISIWISPKSSRPKLAKQLLGQSNSNSSSAHSGDS